MFHCVEIFLSFRIFEQFALALKNTSCPDIFHSIEKFLSFRIFEQLALALKTEFALQFFKTGGRPHPNPPLRTPMAARFRHQLHLSIIATPQIGVHRRLGRVPDSKM